MTNFTRRALMGATALLGATALAGGAIAASHAAKPDKVTVAYFLEWPLANQVAQVEGTYEERLGVPVEFRSFGNGNEMTQAMVSGDVDIAYSQGFVPFVVGVSNNAPIKMVGVAVTYADNDACIVREDAGITKDNAAELEGKKVATPLGNVTHYKFLKSMEALGADASKVELVQMNPADGAVALIRGDVTMACGFGAALDRMKTVGKPLLTGAEQEELGINTFDITSVTNEFAEQYPDLVKEFLAVTEEANQAFKDSPDEKYATIAGAAGMEEDATKNMMGGFGFPSAEDQKGENWMGGGVQEATKGVADVMVGAGEMDAALDDYSQFIDPSFL